jgi:succinate-semialdehyde dehydrogenase/glutarate-semialdehyde dehydrogenase
MEFTASEAVAVERAPSQLYIGGAWRDASDGATLPVEDPSTGETLKEVADASPGDAQLALAAASDAFPSWRRVSPRDRADILRRAYELIQVRAGELAVLLTLEMGKPVAESNAEIRYANTFLRWYSEEAVRIGGRFTMNESGDGRVLTLRQPVGPCLFITPWNFPIAMGARKIGPALAAGCTCVVKPAAQTPLSMLALARVFEEAGLPPGVLNVITTSSAGRVMGPLIEDSRVRKLSFTGSTRVGKELIRQSSEQVLRVSMELGGNAPFLVFADADLDDAIEGAVVAKMRNGGEACTAANRFLVHESLAESFAQRLAARIGGLRVGRGTTDGTQVGPLIDEAQRATVAGLVDDAVDKGAAVLTGGAKLGGPGYFYAPTVLKDVRADSRLLREEIFGPVAPIVPFSSEEEAIAVANDTRFGLVAYVYTSSLNRALSVTEELETGMVGVNQGYVSNAGAPFGGVKQSGYGREGGSEGLDEYLETKYAAINL